VGSSPIIYPISKKPFYSSKRAFFMPSGLFFDKNEIRQLKADALYLTRKTAQLDENVLQMFYNGLRQYGYNLGSGSQAPQKRGRYL
jgi:hypothetical protein